MSESSGRRAPSGAWRPSLRRERYLSLLQEGMTNAQACVLVGINVRTGRDWRRGIRMVGNRRFTADGRAVDGGEPLRSGREISARFLSLTERLSIADLHREGCSARAIAAELGRSPSTITREIHRNTQPGGYRPHVAQAKAEARRGRTKASKIASDPVLRDFIARHLRLRWSPEQIARRLRREFPDQPEMHVVHETIYQALYVQGRGELRRELARSLRSGRARRRPQRRPDQRQSRLSDGAVMISDRPAEIDDRAVPGHWEGDLIIGKDHASAIGTLVERHTRYVLLVHLPGPYTAELVRDQLIATMRTLPAHLRRSLTWDQGGEMALHREFALATDVEVYFCDPGSPWQRGSNENTNGLLRQYFPKSTNLSVHTPEDLAVIAAELNGRPRKTLDWDTPAERLATLLT
ncbi:MAG: family transposase [Nocardioides sp.]|jgi:IS30 family transposase|nr:family transposase [Nocardioides sp.]